MEPKSIDKKVSPSSSILTQIIRKSLISYLLSSAMILAICFIFGWRSLEYIGTGFIYGSLGLALFGALILAGNKVPTQLFKLSIPSLVRHQKAESDDSPSKDEGIRFFFKTLICGEFLFVTGLFLKMLL